jgi:hypothetical protein
LLLRLLLLRLLLLLLLLLHGGSHKQARHVVCGTIRFRLDVSRNGEKSAEWG